MSPTFKEMLKKENFNLKELYNMVEKYGELNKEERKKKLIQIARFNN